jgi:glycosyltransferase involved in cell wall biosynthesis
VNVLYISYDGLMEPLGQSQVFQYLEGLAARHRVVLVSYEKPADWDDVPRRARVTNAAERAGIVWVPLRYHRAPTAPATAYDVSVGLAVCSALVLRHRIQIVHARSYVSSLVALGLKKAFGVRFLFDMRGFWADEKVESGSWKADSRLFHVTKDFERRFLLEADAVVSLAVMRQFPYLAERTPRFEVIPTCTNLERFSLRPPRVPGEFVLGYVGAVGAWDVFDEVARCFLELLAQKPDARLVVINRGGHDYIGRALDRWKVPRERTAVRSAEYAAVPREMQAMDAGIFFYKPGFSRAATAPTKLGEFLACGLPCLCNGNVGDVESILEPERVGVVINEWSDRARRSAVKRLVELAEDPSVARRANASAHRHFSLAAGIRAYDQLYETLGSLG